MLERAYRYTDRPMTWTRALVLGMIIWVIAIILLGQAPSWIIYKFDQEVAAVIDFSKKLPLVNDEGLNTVQVKIVRDVIANTVQNGALIAMLVGAYIWQEKKRKRVGGRGVQDVVKGYMSGK
jgi:hypothetical protein